MKWIVSVGRLIITKQFSECQLDMFKLLSYIALFLAKISKQT